MSAIKLFVPSRGERPPSDWSHPTISQVLDWYEQDVSRRPSSASAEKERVRIWSICRQHFDGILVSSAKPFQLLALINSQKDLKSDWSRKRWNATIQTPFNRAEKMQLVAKNPFRGVTFRPGGKGRDWTLKEWGIAMRLARPRFRRFMAWMRISGMRPGETRDLKFEDIRIEDSCIVIEKHKTRYLTDAARKIPLSRPLGKLLAWIKLHAPAGSKHVHVNSFGDPWTCKAVTNNLDDIREKGDLPKQVKAHGLRHTFATHALMNGVEIAALMELLGHRQLATTQVYVHMGNKVDHLRLSMEKAISKKEPAPAVPQKIECAMPLFDGLE